MTPARCPAPSLPGRTSRAAGRLTRAEKRGGDRASVPDDWVLARSKRDARIRAAGRPDRLLAFSGKHITFEVALHEEGS